MKNRPTSLSKRLHLYYHEKNDPEKYISPSWIERYKIKIYKIIFYIMSLFLVSFLVYFYTRMYYVKYYSQLIKELDFNYAETIKLYNNELDFCYGKKILKSNNRKIK